MNKSGGRRARIDDFSRSPSVHRLPDAAFAADGTGRARRTRALLNLRRLRRSSFSFSCSSPSSSIPRSAGRNRTSDIVRDFPPVCRDFVLRIKVTFEARFFHSHSAGSSTRRPSVRCVRNRVARAGSIRRNFARRQERRARARPFRVKTRAHLSLEAARRPSVAKQRPSAAENKPSAADGPAFSAQFRARKHVLAPLDARET